MIKYILLIITSTSLSFRGLCNDYYWVNDGGNWSDFSNHWATTSGGTIMHIAPPTSNDNVFFDANSFTLAGQIVTADLPNITCENMDWSGSSNGPTFSGNATDVLEIYGNLKFEIGLTNNYLGTIKFTTSFSKTINLMSVPINDCEFNGFGSWTLQGIFLCNGNLKLTKGTFISNDLTVQTKTFQSTGLSARGLTLGASDFIVTGTDNAWLASNGNFFMSAGTSTIHFTNPTSDTVQVLSGGNSIQHNNISIECSLIHFMDGIKGNTLSATTFPEIIIANSVIQFWSVFNLNGICSGYSIIHSDLPGTPGTINVPGTTLSSYLLLKDVTAAGGTFTANNSINEGNVTNWTVNESVSAGYVYWIGNTGNWSNPANWSTGCLPGPQDTIIFNASSFSGPSDIVTVDINGYGHSMKWIGVSGNPILTGSNFNIFLRGSVTLDANMTSTYTGEIEFRGSTGTGNILTNGVVLNGNIRINGTATWQLADNLTSNSDIILELGTFSSNNMDLSIAHFNTDFSSVRTLEMGSSMFYITGDTEAFIINKPSLTLNEGTSEIIFNTVSSNTAYFIGNGETFNNLRLKNKSVLIGGGNTFNIVEIKPGTSVILENAATQSMDSLIANGSCDSTISLIAYSSASAPAIINKTGYDTLIISNVNINHVTANNTAPKFNQALTSILYNTTTGWDTTDIAKGNGYYWVGNTGNWSLLANWESPLGTPASCLPNITDTVYFNNASFSGPGQIVTVDIDAFCAKMDWTGSAGASPIMSFNQNVNVRQDVILNTGVSFTNNNADAKLIFLPQGNNCLFETFEAPIDVDVILDGSTLTDMLKLQGDLKIAPTSELYISEGTFDTNNDSITCGSFFVQSTSGKSILLNGSAILITNELNFNGTHTLTSGTSDIHVGYNNTYSIFHGNGKTYNNVTMYGQLNKISELTGSNSFNNLTFKAGLRLKMQAAKTQTITGIFEALGNCPDSILLFTDIFGTSTSINCSTVPTIEVTNITDINATGTAINALFSTNGGNSNFNFIATPPTSANFTRTFDVCLGNSAVFTNTSTAYSGGLPSLTFSWDFGDGNYSTGVNPAHSYLYGGVFDVELTSTYINGCTDTYLDSVRINDANISFTCSDIDTTICQGDSVTIYANTTDASDYNFLLNGASVQSGIGTDYGSTTLNDGDILEVIVTLNTCPKTSQPIVMNVIPLPIATMTSSVPGNTICEGDTIILTASGAHQYQYFVDGIPQGSYTTSNTFLLDNAINGQVITIAGKDTVTKCTDMGPTIFTITVNPIPTPTFTSSDPDLVICQGDPITFTGSGSTSFEFFINGNPVQGPSTTATFNTNSLNNGDVVTMMGTSSGCSALSGNLYSIIVYSIPVVTATNDATGNIACDSDNVTISASGASSYEFFVNGAPVAGPGGASSFSTTSLITGDIVTVSGNSNGCFATSSPMSFTINPNPTVTLLSSDADNTICFEEGVTFTGSGATDYEFFVVGVSAQGPTTSSSYFTDSIVNGQTISVVGSTNGCSSSGNSAYQFVVNPPFTVNFYCDDIDRTICEGESISFTATGSGVTQFDLLIDETLTSSNTTGLFTLSSLTAGTYIVSVEGIKNGCSRSSATTFTVTVNPIPSISLTSSDADNVICNGDSVYYIGSGAQQYEFFINGYSQGAMSPTDSILTTTLLDGQIITVVGSSFGCTTNGNNDITVSVIPIPTSLIASSDIDNIICQGENLIFTGSGGVLYEFLINGNIVQSQSATDTYSNATLASGDIVSVVAYENGCDGNPANIMVTVNSSPTITTSISDADQTICQGQNISVSALGASTYEFFVDGNSTGAPSTTNIYNSAILTNGQTITVSGASNFGCQSTSSDSYTITVIPLPTVSATTTDLDNIICNGDIVIFNASGADSINFYIDGNWILNGNSYTTDSIVNGQEITINGVSNGCASSTSVSYPFTVYNYPNVGISTNIVNNELCTGETAIIVGHGGLTYEFIRSGSSVLGPGNQDSLIIANLTNGETVYVNAINNGCVSQSTTLTFTVNTTPTVTFLCSDADKEICYGENVTFIANGASEYEFFINNLTQTGVTSTNSFSTNNLENAAYITVIGHNGICSAPSDSSYIFSVLTMDIGLTNTSNNAICSGESVSFTASGADLYEFFVDGTSVQGPSNTATYTNGNLNDGQIITVEGTNNTTGCIQESFNSQLFVVFDNPIVSPAGPISICEGTPVELTGNYPTWNQWYMDGIEIPGETSPSYSAFSSGIYSLSVGIGGDHEVWSVGENSFGQLGDSSWNPSSVTLRTFGIDAITKVDAGLYYTIALDTNGTIYSWGKNENGQLGDGTFGTANYPNTINANTFTDIAAGYQHALAIASDSTVMSWGKNTQGQLGQGNTNTTNFPTSISGLSNVIDIAAGENHSLALLSNGTVVAWGDNQFGQIGDGTLLDKNSPVTLGLSNIVDVAAGANHSMAIDIFGRLWVWGSNSKGQLGLGNITFSKSPVLNGLKDVASIDGGDEHSIAVKDNSLLYTWGDNSFGQLGNGTFTISTSPAVVSSLSGIKYAEAGIYNTFVSKTDNSVWAFGKNANYQLGNENNLDLATPTHIISFSGASDFAAGMQHTNYLASFETSCPSNNVVVTVETAIPVSIIDFDSLLVASQSGVAYQWYINGLAIVDGTGYGQSIIATSGGYYSVEVTYSNGCAVTSDDYAFNIVGINEEDKIKINFFPNPNNGSFFINSNLINRNYTIQILDIGGKIVNVFKIIPQQGLINIQLEAESGMYLYSVFDHESIVSSGKIVIEK